LNQLKLLSQQVTLSEMLLLSPEERAQIWHDAANSEQGEREFKRHLFASTIYQMVGSELSLYSASYADAVLGALDVLDMSGLIGRDELRESFESIDEDRGTVRAFVASLARLLRETALMDRLDEVSRDRAFELSELWGEVARADMSAEVDDEGREFLSVAEVAALYDVTPQAVYKWIHKGALSATNTPGGGAYRVPVAELQLDARTDARRARRLQYLLSRRQERETEISTDEMVREMRQRRGSSQ
jgi:excisionase family DNA binding protein